VAGEIKLYAQALKKAVVADELQITADEVTNDMLAELCNKTKDSPPDILVLRSCGPPRH
jgi:hypothetical protein